MPAQPVIFLLLFGGIQGLLFILFLLHKKLHQGGYIFLLCYLGVMLLQLTLKIMSKVWLMDHWNLLYTVAHYLLLLQGPLAYLFVKHMIEQKTFMRRSLLHFLPFLFVFIVVTVDHYTNQLPVKYIFFNPHVRIALLLTSLGTYHMLALRIHRQHCKTLTGSVHNSNYLLTAWLKRFVVLSGIVCCVIAVVLYVLYINYPAGYTYRYGFAALTFFMYWITFAALKQPVVFSVIKGNTFSIEKQQPVLTVHRPHQKYASSTLHAAEKARICEALDRSVKQEKIYLDAMLTIDRLAGELHCSKHALSQVLNECMQQSFYDYINYYRVEEAKMLLTDERKKAHKVAAIAYDAGFNSLSAFNEVFKKITGCTPSQFRKYPEEYAQRQRV